MASKRMVKGVDLAWDERQGVVKLLGPELGNDFSFTDTRIFEFIGKTNRCLGSIEDDEMIKLMDAEDNVDRWDALRAVGVGRLNYA